MNWLWENAEKLGTVLMAAAAVAALIYAHLQIGESRRAERQANANELWREYLRLAFDNPRLSDPTLGLAQFDYQNRTVDGDPELFQKYELFVDTILNASDEILDVAPSREWHASVRLQLQTHRAYLTSPQFLNSGYLDQYSSRLRAFMQDVLKVG
jgi:hypothetical protein